MALQKTIKLENGVEGNYWKIDNISISKNVQVLLGCYLTQQHRLDGYNPVCAEKVNFENLSFVDGTDAIDCLRKSIYLALKMSYPIKKVLQEKVVDGEGNVVSEEVFEMQETNWFADAIDC